VDLNALRRAAISNFKLVRTQFHAWERNEVILRPEKFLITAQRTSGWGRLAALRLQNGRYTPDDSRTSKLRHQHVFEPLLRPTHSLWPCDQVAMIVIFSGKTSNI